MSCYHPNAIKFNVDPDSGETYFQFLSGQGVFADGQNTISIPCGRCIGCRLDKSKTWADRMMLELDHSKVGVFVTLTYSNEFLPLDSAGVPVLKKSDCQGFFKRLRSRFGDKHIRFYLCGEYGPSTHRPHYHAIIFGLDLSDFKDLAAVGFNEFGQQYFSSVLLSEIWSKGFTSLSEVSWRTCAYVARYVQKKAFKEEFTSSVPEFSLMSRRPGIGGFFYDDHPDHSSASYFVGNSSDIDSGSKQIYIPKYCLGKLDSINPDLSFCIKKKKQEAYSSSFRDELTNTDQDAISYLKTKEREAWRKSKLLKRKEL